MVSVERAVGRKKRQFVENPDVVAIGCSFSSGEFVPDSYTWHGIITQLAGMSINVVAMNGEGVYSLLREYQKVVALYGAPKKIFALWPDLDRFAVVRFLDNNPLADMTERVPVMWNHLEGQYYTLAHEPFDMVDRFGEEHTLCPELVNQLSFDALDTLMWHASTAGIEVTQTSWAESLNEAGLFLEYPGYAVRRDRECDHHAQCDNQERWWEFSLDGMHGGFHDQIHWAEFFLGREITNDEIASIELMEDDPQWQ